MKAQELEKMIKEAYMKGQMDGMKVACEHLCDSVNNYKKSVMEMVKINEKMDEPRIITGN